MEQHSENHGCARAGDESVSEEGGRYVYCVARTDEEVGLGPIGLEGREVYAIAYDGLCALVHDCPARPYESGDGDIAASWVMAHHRVVDGAWRRWGAVLPMTFNNIITAGEDCAEADLKAWLEREHDSLLGRLDNLSGKAEYGVQVSWDPEVIAGKVAEDSPKVRRLEEQARSSTRGMAYMYRQKLERVFKEEMEVRASETFKEVHTRLMACVENIRVEKTKQAEESRQMLMNLTCLVSSGRSSDLAAELDAVGEREGFFVRLAGPLPPYSFC